MTWTATDKSDDAAAIDVGEEIGERRRIRRASVASHWAARIRN